MERTTERMVAYAAALVPTRLARGDTHTTVRADATKPLPSTMTSDAVTPVRVGVSHVLV